MGQITPRTGTPTHTHTHTCTQIERESDLEIHPCWQLAQLEMAKALGECHLNSSLNDRNTASELCRASSCPCPSPCITQQAYLIDSPLCIQSPIPSHTCPQYKQWRTATVWARSLGLPRPLEPALFTVRSYPYPAPRYTQSERRLSCT